MFSRFIGNKAFYKSVLTLLIPIIIQQFITSFVSLLDNVMVGSLGTEAISAASIANQVMMVFCLAVFGGMSGAGIYGAQFFGKGDMDGMRHTFRFKMYFGVLISAAAVLIYLIFGESFIASFLRGESNGGDLDLTLRSGCNYLYIMLWGLPPFALVQVYAGTLRESGETRAPMFAGICAILTNLFGNWVLIFGNLGAPALGVRGAALATVIAQAVSCLVVLVEARRSGHRYLLAVRRHFRWSRRFVSVYLKKCFPIICNEVLIGLGNMVINIVLGRQPEEAIAALAVLRTLEGLVIGFFAGFSNASSVLVGTEVGAGRLDVAYGRAWRLVYLCQGFIALLGVTLVALHTPILTVMGMRGESFRLAFGMLAIYLAAAVIRMGNWTQNDTFRAAGDATTGTVLEIIFMWLMVLPCVCISGLVLKWPTLAVFALCYVDEPIRYVMMHRHLYKGKWIRPVTPEGRAALSGWKPDREKACAG